MFMCVADLVGGGLSLFYSNIGMTDYVKPRKLLRIAGNQVEIRMADSPNTNVSYIQKTGMDCGFVTRNVIIRFLQLKTNL
jgi:hypothetical protein